MDINSVVFGIDLGTTKCCIAYYIDGQIQVLENGEGIKLIPSCVVTDTDYFAVGEHAKHLAEIIPENGIYDIKRVIGRKQEDVKIENSSKNWPFTVNFSDDGKPFIETEFEDERENYTPVEITCILFQKIGHDIRKQFGHIKIIKAVVTVPAYFNNAQRRDTLTAAKYAGINVLKLLNEPTAVALTYFSTNKCNLNDYSLIYNLGGGSFDVSILKQTEDKIETIAVDGDTNLGGHDFDNALISYICDYLIEKYQYNPRNNKTKLIRLSIQCEKVKRLLSTDKKTYVILDGFVKDEDFIKIILSKEDFEELNNSLFKKTIDIVDRCLKKANLSKSDIKKVIMSGGSTRIPKIQSMVSEYFDNKKLDYMSRSDECVAEGAAIQAAMLSKYPKQKINPIWITDVVPLSLGIADYAHRMNVIIPKNTTIPTTKSMNLDFGIAEAHNGCFDIYEGERLDVTKNFFLGSLNIQRAVDCSSVTFTLSIDENGILTAIDEEECEDNLNIITNLDVTYNKRQRIGAEIKATLVSPEENRVEDDKFMKFANRKAAFVLYIAKFLHNLGDSSCISRHKILDDLYCDCVNAVNKFSSIDIDDEESMVKTYRRIKRRILKYKKTPV